MLSSTEEAESILPSLTIFSNQIYLLRSKQYATISSVDGGGGELFRFHQFSWGLADDNWVDEV